MKKEIWMDDDVFYLFWGYIAYKNLKDKMRNCNERI
jgi:hypothetical protein